MILIDIISIILVMLILVVIIIYLININKKLNKKIEQEKNRFILYKKKIKELEDKSSYNKKDFDNLNKLARDFFKERFNLNYSLSYVELSDIFKKQNLDERVRFCDIMTDILYAGQKMDYKEIKTLIEILSEIIEKYKYM